MTMETFKVLKDYKNGTRNQLRAVEIEFLNGRRILELELHSLRQHVESFSFKKLKAFCNMLKTVRIGGYPLSECSQYIKMELNIDAEAVKMTKYIDYLVQLMKQCDETENKQIANLTGTIGTLVGAFSDNYNAIMAKAINSNDEKLLHYMQHARPAIENKKKLVGGKFTAQNIASIMDDIKPNQVMVQFLHNQLNGFPVAHFPTGKQALEAFEFERFPHDIGKMCRYLIPVLKQINSSLDTPS